MKKYTKVIAERLFHAVIIGSSMLTLIEGVKHFLKSDVIKK